MEGNPKLSKNKSYREIMIIVTSQQKNTT